MNLKSLAKDTAIYGLSSIVGRFLNYLLVPLYTTFIDASTGGYGIVNNLYGYTALLLALLTFGMETTLFRFSNKDGEDPRLVYGSILRMVGGVALGFLAVVLVFLQPISSAMGYAAHPEYIACMAAIVAMDAFQAIMFSRLRQQNRPLKFMTLKFCFIIPNVLLNLVAFWILPKYFGTHPALAELYARFDGGVGLIFFINLFCTAMVNFGFANEIKGLGYGFDGKLAKRLLSYSWPLLILSLVGVFNQVASQILYPIVKPGEEGMVELGIYGACAKIAMIMALLTQAFRYAYEPIVFNGSRDRNSPETLSDGMKYFVIFTLLAFLAVIIYMPILQHFIGASYRVGLKVVPIVMLAEIFMGIYFNLSFWYKLSDQTLWGAVMSATGAAVMVLVIVLGIPRWGYMACAWGGFAGYGSAMVFSYFVGQKKYPIRYDMRSMGVFAALTGVIWLAYDALGRTGLGPWPLMGLGTLMLLAYCAFTWKAVVRR